MDYKFLLEFFQKKFVVHERWLAIRSLHTYDMYRMFYFERYCTTTYDKNCLIVSQLLRFLKGEQKKNQKHFCAARPNRKMYLVIFEADGELF